MIGFPLGYQTTAVKVYEARQAVAAGAQELDIVINLAWLKEGRLELIAAEMKEILSILPGVTIKAIMECGLLEEDEKRTLASVLVDAGVHFLKTSTGFGPKGATLEDVRLLVSLAAGRAMVKAAGGIRTWAQARAFLEAGAARLGTSSGVQIMREFYRQGTEETQEDVAEVEIFVDGACLGNPGPGGFAAILRFGDREEIIRGGERHTTNNRMELKAAIAALKALKAPSRVKITTDSRYLMDGITKWLPRWQRNGFRTAAGKPVKNRDLWEELGALVRKHQVSWQWVEGHAGHPENERCDLLARQEAQRIKEAG